MDNAIDNLRDLAGGSLSSSSESTVKDSSYVFKLNNSDMLVENFIHHCKNKQQVRKIFYNYLSNSEYLLSSRNIGTFRMFSVVSKIMSFLENSKSVKRFMGSNELNESDQIEQFEWDVYSCRKYPALTKIFMLRIMLFGHYKTTLMSSIRSGNLEKFRDKIIDSMAVIDPYSEFEEYASSLVQDAGINIEYLNGDYLLFLDRLISTEDFLDKSNIVNVLFALLLLGNKYKRGELSAESIALLFAYKRVLSNVRVSFGSIFDFDEDKYLNLLDFARSVVDQAKKELGPFIALLNSISEEYTEFNITWSKLGQDYDSELLFRIASNTIEDGSELLRMINDDLCTLLDDLSTTWNRTVFSPKLGFKYYNDWITNLGDSEVGIFTLVLIYKYLHDYESGLLSEIGNYSYLRLFEFILKYIDRERFYSIYNKLVEI